MGASSFSTFWEGSSAKKAFAEAVEDAAYEHGHGGYTGTIAEKHKFVHISTVKTKKEALELADRLIDECDSRIDDKWGPAGCITIEDGGFVFFGWASD